ncbi:MAG: UBA/ThiF-type binding protein [Solirubrobacterales bacterium]|nr:UBA/ThiF-type binding protein [Solirubrobacterales bacterium]
MIAPGTILSSSPDWTLRVPQGVWEEMHAHLDPGDGDEHGGALLCGVAASSRGGRLLARCFIAAVDGIDYIPGTVGHRALTASFIRRATRTAAALGLGYVAVHNHGYGASVAFSPTDMASHERGYPALLDLLAGQPAGALVVAGGPRGVAAGDLWHADGTRTDLRDVTVIGGNIRSITDGRRRPTLPALSPVDDRSTRLLGASGLAQLRAARIAVIGCGGAGLLAVEYLARLGVGHLLLVDPDVVDETNLPRLTGARRLDALPWLRRDGRPGWLQDLGVRMATPKVRLARRVARRASSVTTVTTIQADVTEREVAQALTECDFIVLAADTADARHLVNAVVQQYLVPAVQVGVKATVDETGALTDAFATARPIGPGHGCLWCQGLVTSATLAAQLQPQERRAAAHYGTGDAAPAVITLNAIAVGVATSYVMLALAGRLEDGDHPAFRFHPQAPKPKLSVPRRDRSCPQCSDTEPQSRLGRGDAMDLPVKWRSAV